MREVRRSVLVLLLLSSSAGCEQKRPEKSPAGKPCIRDTDCVAGLQCSGYVCRTEAELQRQAREERRAATRQELDLLEQSGIRITDHAEAPAGDRPSSPPPAPPSTTGPIRLSRTTSGRSPAFAACRTDEQLISGGCRADFPLHSLKGSYPSLPAAGQIGGGRWNCECSRTECLIEAYALCAPRLP